MHDRVAVIVVRIEILKKMPNTTDAWCAVVENIRAGQSHMETNTRTMFAEALLRGEQVETWVERDFPDDRPPEWAISMIHGTTTGAVPLDDVYSVIEIESNQWVDLGIGRAVLGALERVRGWVTAASRASPERH